MACFRFVQPREKAVNDLKRAVGREMELRVTVGRATCPSSCAIDSSARTTVVPTAMTRPPSFLARLIFAAAFSLKKYSSSDVGFARSSSSSR